MPASPSDGERLFHGSRFDVHRITITTTDGEPRIREVVVHPGAAVILPVLDDQRVVLIQNDRPAVQQTLYELPAGTLEAGEPPIDCAARELIEETGYRAGRVDPLCGFFSSPGICTEKMHAFAAYDLTHVGQQLEATEKITVRITALQECLGMIRDGRIADGKTIAALLYYHCFVRSQVS